MKTKLTTIALIIFASVSLAQITQEKVFVSGGEHLETATFIELENSGEKYFYYDSENLIINICMNLKFNLLLSQNMMFY